MLTNLSEKCYIKGILHLKINHIFWAATDGLFSSDVLFIISVCLVVGGRGGWIKIFLQKKLFLE